MNEGMVLIVGGLLACASLGVRWGVQREHAVAVKRADDFWPWLAYCLSIIGLTCSVLMFVSFALAIVVPEQVELFSGPIVAVSAGFLIGFFIDQRNARKKQ